MTPLGPEEVEAVFGAAAEPPSVEPLGRGVPAATRGVWLVRSGGDVAVLKVVHRDPSGNPRWPAAAEPEHPYYWRREACSYESGLLERLPGGLRAARCRGRFERDDGSVALWLEALPEASWTVEGYGAAARNLGRMQGVFAARLPDEPWLSRRWLRAYLDLRLEATGPRSAEREAALRLLEAGPQTFCHLDFYPGNLFGDEEETILVDWAYCGIGALGEDPGNLVPDAILDGFVSVEDGEELEHAVWESYLDGLRDSGWAGDERALRFAFAATPWLKYEWLRPFLATGTIDPETAARWQRVLPLVDAFGKEALRLASAA